MSYLQRIIYKDKTLLDHVTMISTVSGGTITGAVYALHKQEEKSFEEYYHFLLKQLRELDLVKMAIEKLNPDGKWHTPGKRKNLINAFAELYDEHLTRGATMASFDTMKPPLEAVVFNSTEFNNAIDFRFRNKSRYTYGNQYNKVSQEAGREVKIADAVAASSSFTVGFEPIMWPADFIHDESSFIKQHQSEFRPAGLMDGGIYDNQGIGSVLMYKKSEHPYFDLVIICDVTSPYMDSFEPTGDKPKKGWLRLTVGVMIQKVKRVNRGISILLPLLAALLLLAPVSSGFANTLVNGICLSYAVTFLLLWGVKSWLLSSLSKIPGWMRRHLPKEFSYYAEKLSHLDIQSLSLRRIEPLLMDRLNSLRILLLDAFLKIIRRLNYNMVYEDEQLQYRRLSCLIRELTQVDFEIKHNPAKQGDGLTSTPTPFKLNKTYDQLVGPEIKKVAELCANFGTTLWFTDKDEISNMLNNLVACGQFTMCYNLVEYIAELLGVPGNGHEELDSQTKEALETILHRCLEDWERFKTNPFFHFLELNVPPIVSTPPLTTLPIL